MSDSSASVRDFVARLCTAFGRRVSPDRASAYVHALQSYVLSDAQWAIVYQRIVDHEDDMPSIHAIKEYIAQVRAPQIKSPDYERWKAEACSYADAREYWLARGADPRLWPAVSPLSPSRSVARDLADYDDSPRAERRDRILAMARSPVSQLSLPAPRPRDTLDDV